MNRFSTSLTFVGVMLVTVAMSAQAPQGGGGRGGGGGRAGGAAPAGPQVPTPKNLQFFPKDMTGQQILPIMQNFNAALGVNCTYCHNSEPPVDNPKNDFASDEKGNQPIPPHFVVPAVGHARLPVIPLFMRCAATAEPPEPEPEPEIR